jgi:hypothetical protein
VNMFLQLLYVSSQVLGFADNKVEPNATMWRQPILLLETSNKKTTIR